MAMLNNQMVYQRGVNLSRFLQAVLDDASPRTSRPSDEPTWGSENPIETT